MTNEIQNGTKKIRQTSRSVIGALTLLTFLTSTSLNGQNIKGRDRNINQTAGSKNVKFINAKTTFWKDRNEINSSSNKFLMMCFGSGFDKKTIFSIFLDRSQLANITCKTNYSVGVCLNSNGELLQLDIPHSKLKTAKRVKIRYGNYQVIISIPANMNKFNRLEISRSPEWNAQFQSSSVAFRLE